MGQRTKSELMIERFQRQRDNAWDALRQIEANLGRTDEMGIGFLLAGAVELEDAAEYANFCEEQEKQKGDAEWPADLQNCREVPPTMITDIFRPRTEPARTLYDAFQAESRHRNGRRPEVWIVAERLAVWRAAWDYSQQHSLRFPTLAEVEAGERYAYGSVDYGAKWAYQVAEKMRKVPHPDQPAKCNEET